MRHLNQTKQESLREWYARTAQVDREYWCYFCGCSHRDKLVWRGDDDRDGIHCTNCGRVYHPQWIDRYPQLWKGNIYTFHALERDTFDDDGVASDAVRDFIIDSYRNMMTAKDTPYWIEHARSWNIRGIVRDYGPKREYHPVDYEGAVARVDITHRLTGEVLVGEGETITAEISQVMNEAIAMTLDWDHRHDHLYPKVEPHDYEAAVRFPDESGLRQLNVAEEQE